MRVVRVNDVRPQPFDETREPPGRGEVHLGLRRDWNQLEAFDHALPQLAIRVRHDRGALTDGPQPIHREQDLILTAPPCASRIDMK